MMHGCEKSDSAIVATKPTCKTRSPSAPSADFSSRSRPCGGCCPGNMARFSSPGPRQASRVMPDLRPSRWANSRFADSRKAWRANSRRTAFTWPISSSMAPSEIRDAANRRTSPIQCSIPTRSRPIICMCCVSTGPPGHGRWNCGPGRKHSELSRNHGIRRSCCGMR